MYHYKMYEVWGKDTKDKSLTKKEISYEVSFFCYAMLSSNSLLILTIFW